MQKNYQALEKQAANYVPLSPLSFIKRAAEIFADHLAIRYGNRQYTWRQTYQRSVRLASALCQQGIKKGDTVSVLLTNTPEMVEAHYGVPMSGAVLNAINHRLDEDTVTYILTHSDCKLLIVDSQFAQLAQSAMQAGNLSFPVILVEDNQSQYSSDFGLTDYESWLAKADGDFDWQWPADEWQALTLSYTSGTSGKPKGVVYHHRGSYLMALGTAVAWQLPAQPKYLYIVPMFHCNGWGHVWTMPMVAGCIVCTRQVSAKAIFDTIIEDKVSHFAGAPIVLSLLINAKAEERKTLPHNVKVMTAGAPPPASVIAAMGRLGFEVIQVYGLTETYGHISHCLWQEKWQDLSADEQAQIKSWQGIGLPTTEQIALKDLESGDLIDCKQQGKAGEILIRGNTIMKGYYKDVSETNKVFAGGFFSSGDIAVWQSDAYVQIKDRLKDVIISGGENISSVEIESVLYKHPLVAHAAVVAKADEKWGEVPCAFVELKTGEQTSEQAVIDFCRQHLAGFKTPKHIIFTTLPKTATGKIQKFKLRDKL